MRSPRILNQFGNLSKAKGNAVKNVLTCTMWLGNITSLSKIIQILIAMTSFIIKTSTNFTGIWIKHKFQRKNLLGQRIKAHHQLWGEKNLSGNTTKPTNVNHVLILFSFQSNLVTYDLKDLSSNFEICFLLSNEYRLRYVFSSPQLIKNLKVSLIRSFIL